MVEANPGEVPTGRIALSLIIGFVLMLIIEQLISPNAHALDDMPMTLQSKVNGSNLASAASVEFDAELGDLEPGNGRSMDRHNGNSGGDAGGGRERAFTLLLGLVFHGCVDGLALGVANLAKTAPGATNTVSFVVFLALILHKGNLSLLSELNTIINIIVKFSSYFAGVYNFIAIDESSPSRLQKVPGHFQSLYPSHSYSIIFLVFFLRC